MKNKIKSLLALALAAFTSLTWAAELVIPYSFDGKASNIDIPYEYQVKMPDTALTSFTTTIRYSGGSHRVEILGVKLIDGETEYTAVATGTDGTEVVEEGVSYSGGNNYLNIFTFTNEEGFTANKVYTLQAMLKVTNNPPSHQGNIKISGGITLYVPPYSFGVNFTVGGDDISTTEGAGFTKGTYAKPTNWGNFTGSASGNGTMTVDDQTIKVYWTSRGTWNSGTDKSTDESKLLYGYLDDAVNGGRTKATVTITGLPSDKQYAVALILSGDGANNTDFNGKFSPALINGQTYSYVDGALVSGDAAKAENAKTWGDRSKAAAAAGLAEGTNVMFVEGLSGSILTITSAMDAQNTSRLTIAGVQVWTTEDAPVAPTAPTDKEVVSLNFYSSQGSVSGEAGLVAALGWNNLAAGGTETTLAVWNGEEAVNYPISLTYSANNGYQYTGGVTDNYIKGYLDDGGSQAQVTVENIPFEEYSVIVYAATDTEARKFKPVLINGSYYAGVATPTAYGYADLVLEGEKNLRSWGASRNAVAAYGKNALRVDGLSGDLTIKGGSNGDGARGGIAAIQIINTGAELSEEQIIDWTAVVNPKASELPELTKPFVQLKLADGVTLEVDAAIAAGHFIEIVGNNVTVNITKIELGKTDVEAIVSGAASVTTSYSETLGYTKDGVTYPLIFRGTTDANWATLSNWYIGTRTQGEITYWIPYTGTVVPGAPNSNEWRATLIDGELMAVVAGEDGYKTVTLPEATHYEGWAMKIAAYNGAHVVLGNVNKFQTPDAGGFLRVDDTSKITFQAYGNGNGAGAKSIYVNALEGIVFAEGTTSGIQNMTYYFDGDGSVAFATLNQAQTIAGLVLDLGAADEGRKVVSRKLIGFTGGGATFTVADGAVTTAAENVTLETADILQNVGQYKFEKKSDGYYVSYVAYAEEDEIGDMNTWTATVDGNWNTPGNWTSGFVPVAGKNATISITTDTTITIPDEVTVDNLTVTGDGTLTIAGGKLAATKIYANANITASETTLALAPMDIAEGKTVTYTTTTTIVDPDTVNNVNHALSLKAMTGAGTFVKKGAGVIALFATAAEPTIDVQEGALYVREAPTTAMNIAAKAGAEIRLAAWHVNFANTANKITLDGGAQLTLANGANVSGTITIANAAETPARICGSSFNASTIAAAITGAGKVEFADGGAFGDATKYPCDGATTYTGVISGGLQVIISDTSAVTFTGTNTYTGGTVIAEGVTLNAGTNSLGTGAVTGAGTLVVAGYPFKETVRNSLGAAEWTGTYVNTADNTLQDNGNWLGAVGNENSVVEFTGANTGFLKQAGSMNAALKVTGSITFNNGWSSGGGYTFNGALLGTGTLATQNSQTDVLKFLGETKDFAGTITVAGGHCIAFGEQADDDSKQGMIVIAAGKTANIAAGKTWTAVNGIEVAGTIGGEGTIGSTLILLNGATLANAMTLEGNVTVAEGTDINHAYADEAGETVITCANADAVAATLTGAPQGLKYVAENGAVKLAVATVNVTIPAAPANTKWFMGETEVSGTIAVDPNTDVTLTLKADAGYVFADGSTSTTVTVNSGNGAAVTAPDVTAATPVAQVGETKYQTFDAAFAAANEGDTIILLAPVTITSDTTIDLAGKNITSDGDVFIVTGGTLTINGVGNITANTDGAGTACALWANGGNAVINGGTWSCGGDSETTDITHQNDTIYTKNGGAVTIIGGTFEYTENVWTLNENDQNRGTISVTGGTFKTFNPANNTSEGANTNFCAEGYEATEGEDGYWTVDLIPVSNYVARIMIGETKYNEYETLEKAFEDAKEMTAPVTVTLLKDIGSDTAPVVVAIPECKSEITFDMGGFKVVGGIDTYYSAKVTIKNGTIESYNDDYPIHVKKGHVILRDVNTLATTAHGLRLEGSSGSRIMCEIYGGTYNSGNYTLYAKSYADMIVHSGIFKQGKNYVLNLQTGTTVTVNGGTFSGTTQANGNSVLTINGGFFKNTITNGEGTENIFGGYFGAEFSSYIKTPGYTFVKTDEYADYPWTSVKADYTLTVNAENATVSALNATYQYEDVVSFTVTPASGYKVTSVVLDGAPLTADAGNYSFSMPAKNSTITVTVEAESTFDVTIGGTSYADAEALKAAAKAGVEMTVPATSTWTAEGNVLKKDGAAYVTFAEYYTVVVNGTTVTLKLNKPVIGESADGADDAFTVTTDAVTIKITNYYEGLNYGVRVASDLNSLSAAEITTVTPAAGVITLEKSAGNSAFYEVVVSDVDFPTASAE